MKRGGEFREQVYLLFSNIIGRNMTKEEHLIIKKILTEYVKAETSFWKDKYDLDIQDLNQKAKDLIGKLKDEEYKNRCLKRELKNK